MANINFVIAIALYIIMFSSSVNSALQCWRCSSDATNGAFCGDRFELDSISREQRLWSYVNCSYPYTYNAGQTQNIRPVCKKSVQEIYGKRVVSRSCFWEDVNDEPDKCYLEDNASYVKTIFCRTCATDGCNTGSGLIPMPAIVLALIYTAKLVTF